MHGLVIRKRTLIFTDFIVSLWTAAPGAAAGQLLWLWLRMTRERHFLTFAFL